MMKSENTRCAVTEHTGWLQTHRAMKTNTGHWADGLTSSKDHKIKKVCFLVCSD